MERFDIAVSNDDLNDLHERLKRARLPEPSPHPPWEDGTDRAYLADLLEYWSREYDWRLRESALNRLQHFRADIDGNRIHFVRQPSDGEHSVPLLLLHGWPGSFIQMLALLPLLRERFDVVIPSLPGYGFSGIPSTPGMSAPAIAPFMHALMRDELGFSRYAIRGGDLGAAIGMRMAADYPESIIGLHTGGTNPYVAQIPTNLTSEEQTFVANAQAWSQAEMAYATVHSTKPQTLAHALNDSPAGLASWIVEKLHRWGDTSVPLEKRLSRQSIVDNLSIYWFTRTIGSSMRLYYETARDPRAWAQPQVPTAFLMSPHDMFRTPRAWIERQGLRIDRWTEIDRGGHFLEWEVPDLVAADIYAFFLP